MATATLTPTGSTRQFEVAYPDSSVSSNLTSEREYTQRVDIRRILSPVATRPKYDYFCISSVPHGAAGNYSAWYWSSPNRTGDPDRARNLARNDWSSLTSELERIAKLGHNWDGEGAEAISEESVSTAATLVKIAQDVTGKVMGRNGALNWLLSAFCGPDIGLSLTTHGLFASIHSNRPGPEQKAAAGLIGDPWDAILAKTYTVSVPGLYPTVEGGVTLKWILRGKELQCTALGDTVEVIRWKSADSYDSDGLWDLKVEQTREHFEWLMR